jgi:putative heme iron utilization protein
MSASRTSQQDPGRLARDLLAGRFEGVLSTLATDPAGQPFGSVVPYCLDRAGRPLLLLSHLAQHTGHLQEQPRCSLTLLAAGSGDVQQRSRLTCLGQAHPIPAADGERYLRYFPQGRTYLEELNFHCYRIEPERFHFNAGFATARWLGTDRVMRHSPFSHDQETAILEHMNGDHADTLHRYLGLLDVVIPASTPVVMTGIDAEGMDLRAADNLYRIPLPQTVDDVATARATLVALERGNTLGTAG